MKREAVGDFYWWKLDPTDDWLYNRMIFLNKDCVLVFGGKAEMDVHDFERQWGTLQYWSKFK